MEIKHLGIPDYFVEHGSVREQRMEVGLTAENIALIARKMITQERKKKYIAKTAD